MRGGIIAASGFFIIALLVACATLGSGGGAAIDRNTEGLGNGEGGILATSTVTTSINYQGRVTDSEGNPLDGTYTMTFSLYEASTGGSSLDSDTHSVTVTNGLFNTYIDFDPDYFDGKALWLAVTMGADPEMTPRQELRPVPYALSLRPGAEINGAVAGNVLDVVNTETTNGQGVHIETMGKDSPGVFVETNDDESEGITVRTTGIESPGVYASTSGENSVGVHGNSSNGYGIYGEGAYGGYFTTSLGGTSPIDRNAAVNVSTGYNYSEGVRVETTGLASPGFYATTHGLASYGLWTATYGDNSYGLFTDTYGDDSTGVLAFTDGNYSEGFSGHTDGEYSRGITVDTDGNYSEGVYAKTWGAESDGVAVTTYGNMSHGVYVLAYGDDSTGIYAHSLTGRAIYADTGRADYKYGVHTQDKMYAMMGYDTGSSDVAEYFAVSGDVEPGTVMIIGAERELQSSSAAYDTRVAGIVSTAPGMSLGTKEESNEGEELIAVAGRVPCKVDATYAPIEPGDLLTTSDTPGYAMKASNPQLGTILGKALEPLESGTDVIEVIVTLQ